MRFSLMLAPYEAKVVVVGPVAGELRDPDPSSLPGTTLAELGGDWSLDLNGQHMNTPLKSWQDLGAPSFVGPATYRKQFTAPAAPVGKRVFLEIADVRDYARLTLNGKQLEGYAWQPYRWDITDSLQPGNNDVQITVFATPAGRGGGGAVPTGAAPAASGARAGQVGPAGSATAIAAAGGGNLRGLFSPVLSGLLGPVRLVAR